MPTLNVKLTVEGQPLDDPAVYPHIRVGENRFDQDTPDKAGHSLMIEPGGAVAMEYLPAGSYKVWPFAEGYTPVVEEDNPRNTVLVDGENPQIEIAMRACGTEEGFLHAYDHGANLVYGFAQANGAPWQMRGYSAHLLPVCVLKGEDIRPFIRRAQSYGANTLVTIGTHLSPWKDANGWHFDPRNHPEQDALARMFDVGAEEGIRFAHAVAADMQGLSDDDKRRIWHEQCALMDGRWNLFARCGNESNVNGWDPALFDRPNLHGVLQSAGSSGEGNPPHQQYRDFSEWEARRSPWHKALDDAGAGMFEQLLGYADQHAIPVPTVMIEGLFFADTDPDHVGDRRSTDPERALMLGLQIGASCAGGAVGTSLGLEGKMDGPVAAECARQQLRGMRAGFLR